MSLFENLNKLFSINFYFCYNSIRKIEGEKTRLWQQKTKLWNDPFSFAQVQMVNAKMRGDATCEYGQNGPAIQKWRNVENGNPKVFFNRLLIIV